MREEAHITDDLLWHRRMGHSSHFPVKKVCQTCLEGKQIKSTFENLKEELKPRNVLEVISSDVCGPLSPATYDGCRYFVTFIDHYSHFSAVYLIKSKAEVLEKFKSYVKYNIYNI